MRLRNLVLLALLAVVGAAQAATAQAFCALRDPVRNIVKLRGKRLDFRSSVQTIDHVVRKEIDRRLPFSLHAREIGRHTLYVLSDEGLPAGYIHARSEASPWGMIEIVWSLDEALRVRDFRFQRCRSPHREQFESERFREWLRGLGYDELRDTLAENGTRVSPDLRRRFGVREQLAVAVLRSALKTILVTEIGWGGEIADRRMESMLRQYADAKSFEQFTVDGAPVFIARDASGAETGRAVRLPCPLSGTMAQGLFAFDAGGELLACWGGDLCVPPDEDCEPPVPGQPAGESQPCDRLRNLQQLAKTRAFAAR